MQLSRDPPDEASRIAVREVRNALGSSEDFEAITLVAFDEEMHEVLRNALVARG